MGLEYYGGEPLAEGKIRLSPSSISNMFRNSGDWYQESILKKNPFSGNTASRLGSIIHNRIELFYQGKTHDKQIEEDWLAKEEESDMWAITEVVDDMFEQWVEQFGKLHPKPEHLEKFMSFEPMEDIVVSGSCDAIFGDTITDWKTSKAKKSSIGAYMYQLYIYAWLARKEGMEINNIQVVYIMQPTKTMKSRIEICKEPICEERMTWLLSRLKLESELLLECRDNPSLVEKYYRSNPLGFGK